MLQPMRGVRVLEVAQFTFVPAAGAVLADWGAEVIKVEHAEKGDAQRGLTTVIGVDAITKGTYFNPVFEGPNRGKRSVGLSLDVPEAREVLDELIKRSDVFLTNYLPGSRASCTSTSRMSARQTPTSSTCAVPGSARGVPRRTRAATT